MKKPLIGEILIEKFGVSSQDIAKALDIQKKNGGDIGQILIQLGSITESQLLEALSEQLSIPIKYQIDELRFQEIINELSTKINLDFFYKNGFLPFDKEDHSLLTLTTDPLKIHIISKLEQDTKLKIKLFLTYERYIKSLYRKYIDTNTEEFVSLEEEDPERLKDMALEVPVIKYLNDIITRAVELNASDIHIEPQEKRFIVRFRIDGVLHEMDEIDENFYLALTSRIKLLSGLDIAEKRLPQDGKFSVRIGSSPIDIRTSTIPTVKGEDVVIRLLYRGKLTFELDKLGIKKDHYDILVDLIKRPYGMILVTGPTGSGKTTTLYSVLSMLNSEEDKIITIEDPVEYQIEGLNQIQIKPDIGLTFASALRSILRHDPDIIMVGEIRDKETAEISIQSALTGHLVFSTLHTNDAPSSLFRLLEMGIEDYLINASILGIVAQRIVRTNCPYCSEPVNLEDNIVRKFKLDQLSEKFDHLLEKKEFRIKFRNEIRNAMAYPMFLIFASLATLVAIFKLIIPRFFSIFGSNPKHLPLISRFLYDFSKSLNTKTEIAFTFIIIGLYVISRYFKLNLYQKLTNYFVYVPILGNLIIQIELSKFCYAMYAMLKNGVEFIKALDLATNVIRNDFIKEDFKKTSPKIKEGKSISEAFDELSFVPPIFKGMIKVGDESGNMKDMFYELYSLFDEKLKNTIKKVLSLVEPIIITVMGLVVGTIVVSLMLTVMSVSNIKL